MTLTTTRLYKSTDAGAPVLTGQAGSMISLLHACLVGTAGVAYGSGGGAKAAAGWSEPFTSAGNIGVWRNALSAGGSGCSVRVSDNGPGTYGAREAMLRVYGAMTDIDTGTDPTPTVAARTNGVPMRKSDELSSSPRAWTLSADERTFYLCVEFSTSNGNEKAIYGAGDFRSHIPADPMPFFAMGMGSDTASTDGQPIADWITGTVGFVNVGTQGGIYLGRGYAGGTGSVLAGVNSKFRISEARSGMGGAFAPMAATSLGSGARYFEPALLVESGTIRGALRGMYTTGNNLSAIPVGTVLTGLSGRPIGSELCLLGAGNRVGSSYTSYGSGRVAVESALEWG